MSIFELYYTDDTYFDTSINILGLDPSESPCGPYDFDYSSSSVTPEDFTGSILPTLGNDGSITVDLPGIIPDTSNGESA